MKTVIACITSLCVASALILIIGQAPTNARWGQPGIESLRAVSAICLGATTLSFIPVAFIALKWPGYIGQAALGGTAIRLLLTMAAGGIYQAAAKPHLPSFLFWAVLIYCVLLAIETGFSVYMTRRFPSTAGNSHEVSA